MYYLALGKEYGFTLDTPICDFSNEAYNALLYGTGGKKLKMRGVKTFAAQVPTMPSLGEHRKQYGTPL